MPIIEGTAALPQDDEGNFFSGNIGTDGLLYADRADVAFNKRVTPWSATGGPLFTDDNPGLVLGYEDARFGRVISVDATLSVTPGTTKTVEVPEWGRGFRLRPVGAAIRYGIEENPTYPVSAHPATDDSIVMADFGVGATAVADEWTVRRLTPQIGETARVIHLRGGASVVVVVEIF